VKKDKEVIDMPGHEALRSWDTYTTVPLLVFQIQSIARLTPIESMVFNHVVLHSVNVFGIKNPNARKYVSISPSEFGKERGFSRQAIQEALKKLTIFGLIECRETILQTISGPQKGREYALVKNEKLNEIFELMNVSAKPRSAKPSLALENLSKEVSAKPGLADCQARLSALAGQAWQFDRPALALSGVSLSKSLTISFRKESSKSIKNFLNTFLDFENSFYELYSLQLNSKAAISKMELEIIALIRRYGLFQVYIAMSACLFQESAEIGNLNALKAFLKNNSERLKAQEALITLRCDNLYLKLKNLYEELSETIRLEIFRENFRQQASLLLLREEFDQKSNEIFIYNGFKEDVIKSFETSRHNLDRFQSDILKNINLYFQAKILGMKGLNYVHAQENNF
jgi:hypothetical protein